MVAILPVSLMEMSVYGMSGIRQSPSKDCWGTSLVFLTWDSHPMDVILQLCLEGVLKGGVQGCWTCQLGHTRPSWPGMKAVPWVAFSSNGSQLVSASPDSVYVWNTETWARYGVQHHFALKRAEFSNDGRFILIDRVLGEKLHVDTFTLKKVDPPESWVPATFPAPRFPVFLSGDQHSLCLKKGNQTIHFCWFPDSFVAYSNVAQYRDMVCVGGRYGEVLCIDLAGFEVPDI